MYHCITWSMIATHPISWKNTLTPVRAPTLQKYIVFIIKGYSLKVLSWSFSSFILINTSQSIKLSNTPKPLINCITKTLLRFIHPVLLLILIYSWQISYYRASCCQARFYIEIFFLTGHWNSIYNKLIHVVRNLFKFFHCFLFLCLLYC